MLRQGFADALTLPVASFPTPALRSRTDNC